MNIAQRIAEVKRVIYQAQMHAQRPDGSVTLLAVSKGQPQKKIREAHDCGIRHFAENYSLEAQQKQEALADMDICWHFIGSVQSNKTQQIAAGFDWVHSLTRLKTAELLNRFRPQNLPPLNICIQVNLSGEKSKSGIRSHELYDLMNNIKYLPKLRCRGLMTIAPATADKAEQIDLFTELHQILMDANQSFNNQLDTLSMGMSNDLREAINAGSTMVRIGRAIFGERTT